MEDKLVVLMKLFELNEKYHDRKEQMVWLVTTVYLGFIVSAIAWLSDAKHYLAASKPSILAGSTVAFLIALLFAFNQNKLKAQSADINGRLRSMIKGMDNGRDVSFADINSASLPPRNRCWKQWLALIWSQAKAGLLCLLLMALFYAFLFYLILTKA